MAWKIIIYQDVREEVVEDEIAADEIVDHETRIHQHYCEKVECDDSELDEKIEIRKCPHTHKLILQIYNRNDKSWLCLHRDTRKQEVKEMADFKREQKEEKIGNVQIRKAIQLVKNIHSFRNTKRISTATGRKEIIKALKMQRG